VSGLDLPVHRAAEAARREAGPLDRAFLTVLLREAPAEVLFRALAARQEASGAVADDPGPTGREVAAGLGSTLGALERLDAIGRMDHPLVERAVDFVAARQDAEGAFLPDAAPGAAPAAPAAPAEAEAALARTGRATGLLAKTPFARPSLLRRAEAWLASRWSVEQVQGPRYAPILAYTHALTQVDSEIADEALQWCGRELERGFRRGVFGPLAVAQVMLRARASAIPGAAIEAQEVVVGLVTAQAPDGRFAEALPEDLCRGVGDDDAAARDGLPVRATLLGLEALLRLGFSAA